MSGQPTVCTCLPPFPKEGGTLYGLPVFHHEPGCPMPYEPEAAAPSPSVELCKESLGAVGMSCGRAMPCPAHAHSPSVEEARATFWNHVYGGTSFMENERGKAAMDALVAAVRREEQQKARENVDPRMFHCANCGFEAAILVSTHEDALASALTRAEQAEARVQGRG